MATRQYKTALLITGDASSGVRATRLTGEALEKLEAQQLKGKGVAAQYANAMGGVSKQLLTVRNASIAAAVAATGLFAKKSLTEALEFERGLVAVGKTTDLAGEALESLGRRIDVLSTRIPVSTRELLKQAEAAGQLGVTGSANILKFTETMAKMERATDLVGDEGSKAIARILNVTGDGIETVDRFGSVIVALGNASAASESEIVRITTEVARSTSAFDVGATAAAGLGAAMASMGIRAELGGSAVGRTLQTITDAVMSGDIEHFARQFDLSGESLANAFARDRVEALLMFLDGVKAQGLGAGAALEAVGLGGAEIAKTIIPLSNNIDILRTSLALANQEATSATALNTEFARATETSASQIEQLSSNLSTYARNIGEYVLPPLNSALKLVNEFLAKNDQLEQMPTGSGNVAAETAAEVAAARAERAAAEAAQREANQARLVNSIQAVTNAERDRARTTANLNEMVAVAIKDESALNDSRQALIDRLDPLQALSRQYALELAEIQSYYAQRDDQDGYLAAVASLSREFDIARNSLQEVREEAPKFAAEYERAIERIDDAFYNLFRSAFDDWGSFKDQLLNSAKDLAAQMAYQFAKQQFGFSSTQFAFGGGGAGSMAGGATNSILRSVLGTAGYNAVSGFASGAISNIRSAFGFGGGAASPVAGALVIDPATGHIVKSAGGGAAGGFSPMGMLKGAGASLAGGFIGTTVGSKITGKEANSSTGATAGAIIGSAIPGIGTFIGAIIGGFLDSLFGSKNKPPEFNIGATQQGPMQMFDGANLEKVVGSAFGNVRFRTESDYAKGSSEETRNSIFGFIDAMASVEDSIAALLDPAKTGQVSDRLKRQPSLVKSGDTDFTPFFVDRFNLIFDEIGGEVNSAFDRLAKNLTPDEFVASIDKIAAAAFTLAELGGALDIDIVQSTIRELDRYNEIQNESLRAYRDSTTQLQLVINEFDTAAQSALDLSNALAVQRAAAVGLVTTYANLRGVLDTTFGAAADSIRESVMSDEDLYAVRRAQISDLVADLGNTIDPDRIASLSSEIARLASAAFSILDPGQQSTLAPEFQTFLGSAQATAQDRLDAGLAAITAQEEVQKIQVELLGIGDFASAIDEFRIGVSAYGDSSSFVLQDFGRSIDDFGGRTDIFLDSFGNATDLFNGIVEAFGYNASDVQAALDAFPDELDGLFVQSILGIDGAAAKFTGAVAAFAAKNPEVSVQLQGMDIFSSEITRFTLSLDGYGDTTEFLVTDLGRSIDDFGGTTSAFIDSLGNTTDEFDQIIAAFGFNVGDVQAALNAFPDELDSLLIGSLLGIDGAADKFEAAVTEFANSNPKVKIELISTGGNTSSGTQPETTIGPSPQITFPFDVDIIRDSLDYNLTFNIP